jgi:hypothetical protein
MGKSCKSRADKRYIRYNNDMITERPFVPKWSIVGSYRPGADEHREGVFKSLRQKGLVSAGVPRSVQQRGTGKLAGQLRLYCVLNQDAARLARHGLEVDAARLVERAASIEHSKDAAFVVDALLAHVKIVTPNYDEIVSAALASAAAHDAVRKALLRVSARVDKARADSKALGTIQRTALGRVMKIHGDLVDVLLQGGRAIVLDTDTLAAHNLVRLGAPLALHWEKWGKGQAFFEAEPGIDLGESAEALQARFPFLRHPAPDDEAWTAASTITGAVTIGRDVAVARPAP